MHLIKQSVRGLAACFALILLGAGPPNGTDRFQEIVGTIKAKPDASGVHLGIGDQGTISVAMPASIEGRRVVVTIKGDADEKEGKDTINYHMRADFTVTTPATAYNDYWPIAQFVPDTMPNSVTMLQIKAYQRHFVPSLNGRLRAAQLFTGGTPPNTNVFLGPAMPIGTGQLTSEERRQVNNIIGDLEQGRRDVAVEGGGVKRLQWYNLSIPSCELQRGTGVGELVLKSSLAFERKSVYEH